SACTDLSLYARPIRRFTSNSVCSGLIVAWFFAPSPIRRSSFESHATYDGVMRLPWSFAMISTFWSL
ncbi:hypothetical protein PybrP1_002351, partial [[Pythium] brassicae (nom. inval.)]